MELDKDQAKSPVFFSLLSTKRNTSMSSQIVQATQIRGMKSCRDVPILFKTSFSGF